MDSLERMLGTLARLGVAQAKDLARELGVSQPTVSRLLGAAGDRVCRMGQTRATRYARTRTLPGLGTRLPLYRVLETGKVEPFRALHLLDRGLHWLSTPDGTGTLFEGLPPFASDMSPQGYVGRTFSARYPELELPSRLGDWNDDHRLMALARRGEDCVGNLILGEESLNRWLARTLEPVGRTAYPDLARRSAREQPGSSAGGEHPKFLTYSGGRHVLVKFVSDDEGAVARRWRELLVCESLALEVLRDAGLEAATAHWFDERGYRFLEVERFDRLGERGRRGVLSLEALDNEYIGDSGRGASWTRAASKLLEKKLIGPEDARHIRWLDVFGQLIGNTDRHFGNVSFLEGAEGTLRLAPAYDMLPMLFAPSGTTVVDRPFEPAPPTADTLDVWPDAARSAHAFWTRVVDCTALGGDFRALARQCRNALEALRERVPL
ncbi:type II toxin-antitoxin system HipA family toxin YjjJ [Archangium sp.]|uniref:type II toxin-antitoxin system HipA family toxin YjjJ n=1 Tax=Archangium sp. TaxID=1872627 RepID=UPI002D490500|nr:type II toxin-antitoxin system HipA family toxin YjjJ [Archangium sp.]HYO51366.1 type II toxin-antitoxin system HipA family toxin YjjJ [Archangium sp.]